MDRLARIQACLCSVSADSDVDIDLLAQIQAWLCGVSADSNADIVSDLLEHGHALAAAYRLDYCSDEDARDIIRAIELATPDDETTAAGIALSCVVRPGVLHRATALDSPLRHGFVGGCPFTSQVAVECFRAADARARSAIIRINNRRVAEDHIARVSFASGDSDPAQPRPEDEFECVLRSSTRSTSRLVRVVREWVANNTLDPEIALLFAINALRNEQIHVTAANCGWFQAGKSIGEVIAAGFEQKRIRSSKLVLPPVIV